MRWLHKLEIAARSCQRLFSFSHVIYIYTYIYPLRAENARRFVMILHSEAVNSHILISFWVFRTFQNHIHQYSSAHQINRIKIIIFAKLAQAVSIPYQQFALVRFLFVLLIVCHWLSCVWAMTLQLSDPQSEPKIPTWIDDVENSDATLGIDPRRCIYIYIHTYDDEGLDIQRIYIYLIN